MCICSPCVNFERKHDFYFYNTDEAYKVKRLYVKLIIVLILFLVP